MRHYNDFLTLLVVFSLFLVIAPACTPRHRKAGFLPRGIQNGRETTSPFLSSTPLPRAQHTFGSVGESLFPCTDGDGEILYYATSRHGPTFSIVKKKQGFSPVVLVTGGDWNDIHPAISPDGRRLVYTSDREGSWHLYLEEDDTPARRLGTMEGDFFGPSWASDSRRLAYFRRGGRSGDWEIWLLDVEGGTETHLGAGLFPAWSPAEPDGEWIAYQEARNRDGNWYSIWKVRPDGTHRSELIINDSWGAVHPSWSPDGRWIAFAVVGKSPEARGITPATARADDIFLIRANGTQMTNLTGRRVGIAEWNPFFDPDGRIYFNSDEGGSINIWSLNPKLGE